MKKITLITFGMFALFNISCPVQAASVTFSGSIEPLETFYQPFRVTNTLGSYTISASINFGAKFTLLEEENTSAWVRLSQSFTPPGGVLWNSFQLSPLFGNRLYTLMITGENLNSGGGFTVEIGGTGYLPTEISLYTPYKTSNVPVPSHESLGPGLVLIGSYLFLKKRPCGKT